MSIELTKDFDMASPYNWDLYGERNFSVDDHCICNSCRTTKKGIGLNYAVRRGISSNLCTFCADRSRRFKLAGIHRFEAFQKNRYLHCQSHKEKYLNLFCFNHFTSICENGYKGSHTECQVKPFVALRNINRKETDLLMNHTMQMRRDMLKTMVHKQKDIADQKYNALKMDRDYWYRIQTQIKWWKRKSKMEIHDTFEKLEKRINDTVNKAIEMQNRLEQSIAEIYTNNAGNSQVHCLEELPIMIAEVKQAVEKVHEPNNAFEIPDYLISLEKYVGNMNNQSTQSVDATGGIDLMSDSVDLETDSGSFDSYNNINSQSFYDKAIMEEHVMGEGEVGTTRDIQNTTTKRTDSLYVKTKEDHDDCCITGMSICGNGDLLLVDCYNKRIKLFSSNGDYITSVKTSAEPFDVTVTVAGGAAVSMWMNQKEIVLIDVKRSGLNILGYIKLRNRIYGIVSVDDDFVISCDDTIPSVRRVDRSGNTIWELSFSTDGRKVFKAPGYLVTKKMSDIRFILVSDMEKHCIAMVDAKTGELVKVLPQSKRGPLGLTIGSFDHVYVGYRYDAGIRIWCSNMDEHKTILSGDKELKRPQAIAFSPYNGELLISSWRCNEIERFKIFYP